MVLTFWQKHLDFQSKRWSFSPLHGLHEQVVFNFVFKLNFLFVFVFQVKALQWLPDPLPHCCKMIITTTFTDLTYKSLTSRTDVQILSCPHISDPSVQRSILLRHLALPYKELPTSVLQRIVHKKQCHLPAFLALIGTELRTCAVLREKEQEIELLQEYVEADSVPELWVKVIRRWVKDFSRTAPTEVTETRISTASLREGKSFLLYYIKPCLSWLSYFISYS